MSDLVAFLNARLDEDEALAQHAAGKDPAPWSDDGGDLKNAAGDLVMDGVDYGGVSVSGWAVEHMAAHDPARVLREVEAKRRILAEHPYRDEGTYGSGCDNCHWDNEFGFNMLHSDSCNTLLALAAVHSDHPDYDPAWASA